MPRNRVPFNSIDVLLVYLNFRRARSISRLLKASVRAILAREVDADDILAAIYAA